ncbi:MAG: DUF1080 domain-containing protein, partial [Planctomycetes bacterium]|nr:DUF1080 domain-containing protein [Planctomycetota bacterium]
MPARAPPAPPTPSPPPLPPARRPPTRAGSRCSTAPATAPAAGGWITLFDGGDVAKSFRGFKGDAVPSSWVVKDGCLVHMKGGNDHMAGGDLVTKDTYGSFELELEWKVTPGGNSGIFYHAMED